MIATIFSFWLGVVFQRYALSGMCLSLCAVIVALMAGFAVRVVQLHLSILSEAEVEFIDIFIFTP